MALRQSLLAYLVALVLFSATQLRLAMGQQSDPKIPAPLAVPTPPGQIVESVPCASDSTETYALYLPSSYTPSKNWPIIYTFDPLAYGKTPVKLYKDVAEKYGYILAASNNSRNFQSDSASRAARAMWDDTHARFSLDRRRIYMMGFSGGARVATSLAIRCEPCAVAGVIALGAGYPFPPSNKDRFAYFSFVGDQDFNWPEIMELRRTKEDLDSPYRLRVFEGEHQWAPPPVFSEALDWLQLKAMQAGTAPRDAAFIDQQFAKTQKEADDAQLQKDAIAEFEACRSLANDFDGLKDVSHFQPKLAALKNSPELKQAFRKQQEAIQQQDAITRDLSTSLARIGGAAPDEQISLRTAVVDGMLDLKSKAALTKNQDQRLVYLRAFASLWAQGIEAGQAELERTHHFDIAESYFQMISTVSPDEPWPQLLLAETAAARGDKKRTIKALRESIKRGLKNPDAIDHDTNLQSMRSDPEFQQIVAELKAKRDAASAAAK